MPKGVAEGSGVRRPSARAAGAAWRAAGRIAANGQGPTREVRRAPLRGERRRSMGGGRPRSRAAPIGDPAARWLGPRGRRADRRCADEPVRRRTAMPTRRADVAR
ncbi:hypothetical protein BURPS668_A1343 [Burkholderia pseudomallei 668]|nr:hypothetical protein BURPS668_A1343 [Burkholderia pseudomallei 668]